MGINAQLIKLKYRKLGRSVQKNQKCKSCDKILLDSHKCNKCNIKQCKDCLTNLKCDECNCLTAPDDPTDTELFKYFYFFCPFCARNIEQLSTQINNHECIKTQTTEFKLIDDLKSDDEISQYQFNEIKSKPNTYSSLIEIESKRQNFMLSQSQNKKSLNYKNNDGSDSDQSENANKQNKDNDSDSDSDQMKEKVSKGRGRPRKQERDELNRPINHGVNNSQQTSRSIKKSQRKDQDMNSSDLVESDEEESQSQDSEDYKKRKKKNKVINKSKTKHVDQGTKKQFKNDQKTPIKSLQSKDGQVTSENNTAAKQVQNKIKKLICDDASEISDDNQEDLKRKSTFTQEQTNIKYKNTNETLDQPTQDDNNTHENGTNQNNSISADFKSTIRNPKSKVTMEEVFPELHVNDFKNQDEELGNRRSKKHVNQNVDNIYTNLADFADKKNKQSENYSQSDLKTSDLSKHLNEIPQQRYDWQECLNQKAKLSNLLWTFADEESSLYQLLNMNQISKDIPMCCNHYCKLDFTNLSTHIEQNKDSDLKECNLSSKNTSAKSNYSKIANKTSESTLQSSLFNQKQKCNLCQSNTNLIKGFIGLQTDSYTLGIILTIIYVIIEKIKSTEFISTLQSDQDKSLLQVDIQFNLSIMFEQQYKIIKPLIGTIYVFGYAFKNHNTTKNEYLLIIIDKTLNYQIKHFNYDKQIKNYSHDLSDDIKEVLFSHVDESRFKEMQLPCEFSKCSVQSFNKLVFQTTEKIIDGKIKIINKKKEVSAINLVQKSLINSYEYICNIISKDQQKQHENVNSKSNQFDQFNKSFFIYKILREYRNYNNYYKIVNILNLMKNQDQCKKKIEIQDEENELEDNENVELVY